MGNEDDDPFNRFKKSGKSCKKSADSCKQSDDPCKKSEDTCKELDDPYNESNEPCKESKDPCKDSNDPCKESDDPYASSEKDRCKSTRDSDPDPCNESRVSCKESVDSCESDPSSHKNACDPYPDFTKPKQSPCKSSVDTTKRPSIFTSGKKKSADTAINKDLDKCKALQAKCEKIDTQLPSGLKAGEATTSGLKAGGASKKDPKKRDPSAAEKDCATMEKFKDSMQKIQTRVAAAQSEKISKKSGNKLQDYIKKNGIMQKLGPGIMGNSPKIMIQNAFAELKKYFKQQQKGDHKPPGKKMADKAAGPPSRPMKFPYTFSAKIAQFPLGYYIKNQWIWRYYFISLGVCLPVFYSIHKLANSPANVAKWAEIRRKEAAEHH